MLCLICYTGLDTAPASPSGDERVCTTICGHIFHAACLNAWWRNIIASTPPGVIVQYSCPFCRSKFLEATVFRVYPIGRDEAKFHMENCVLALRMENEELQKQLRVKEAELQKLGAEMERLIADSLGDDRSREQRA